MKGHLQMSDEETNYILLSQSKGQILSQADETTYVQGDTLNVSHSFGQCQNFFCVTDTKILCILYESPTY